MDSVKVSAEDLTCPVCCEIFTVPVILSCSHSVCKECLQQFWKTKNTQECPVCRRRSSKDQPPKNLALKNLCELYLQERNQGTLSGSEEVCGLHSEKLKLFCLEDKQPVCLVCRDSEKHVNHTFRPISEVIPSYKETLNTTLKTVQKRLKHTEKNKEECEETVQHIKAQARHTEKQIKEEFNKLHQFLRDEENATITALREEEEQKNQMMMKKLEEMNRQISALSDTLKGINEKMKADDVSFLKNFNATVERAQSTQQDPEKVSGALINVAHHFGNLSFRVWKKMQDIVQNTPVILDPNTAEPYLLLSDDMTGFQKKLTMQSLPCNPERFKGFPCVLGSEGFNSGSHCWDVQVAECKYWIIGITTASNQRIGGAIFISNVWCVQYTDGNYMLPWTCSGTDFTVEQKCERVRVQLDWDKGKVSFSDPVTNTHMCTFTSTFKETIFPLFCSYDFLKILPVIN